MDGNPTLNFTVLRFFRFRTKRNWFVSLVVVGDGLLEDFNDRQEGVAFGRAESRDTVKIRCSCFHTFVRGAQQNVTIENGNGSVRDWKSRFVRVWIHAADCTRFVVSGETDLSQMPSSRKGSLRPACEVSEPDRSTSLKRC